MTPRTTPRAIVDRINGRPFTSSPNEPLLDEAADIITALVEALEYTLKHIDLAFDVNTRIDIATKVGAALTKARP